MHLAHHTWGDAANPPALLVHGAVDCWTTWARVGPRLAERGWHVIAPDLRGHGASQVDGVRDGATATAMAADLVETVSVLRPEAESVEVLIGHSLGATVGLVCAVEHPTFVKRLVLEDPPGPTSYDGSAIRNWIQESIVAARENPDGLAQEWLDSESPGPRSSPDEVRAKVSAIAAADPDLLARFQGPPDLTPLAGQCSVPTLVLLGRNERGASVMIGDDRIRFGRALERGTLVELAAGHDLHQPVFDDFMAALEDWLAKTESSQRAHVRERPTA
jgi:pimeloyl-ACP methyl ester carboxylesterase